MAKANVSIPPLAIPPTAAPSPNSNALRANASPVINSLSSSYRFLASKSNTIPSPRDSCVPSAVAAIAALPKSNLS